jgi:hypothetical protein
MFTGGARALHSSVRRCRELIRVQRIAWEVLLWLWGLGGVEDPPPQVLLER